MHLLRAISEPSLTSRHHTSDVLVIPTRPVPRLTDLNGTVSLP